MGIRKPAAATWSAQGPQRVQPVTRSSAACQHGHVVLRSAACQAADLACGFENPGRNEEQ